MYHRATWELVADAENFVGAIATFVVEERVIEQVRVVPSERW